MSYIRIEMERHVDFDFLGEQLETLGFFKRTEDWHEKLLKGIDRVGLSRDCHPAKSILRYKERVGKAYAVDFVLSSGRKLDGQLSPTCLRVSDKVDERDIDTEDKHIQDFLDLLGKYATVTAVKINHE